jgi:hypothetical protein
MEEAEQKRKNGQTTAGVTPEQAAEDARQVLGHLQHVIIGRQLPSD